MTGLRHRALLYEGVDEFLAAALPFVRDGVCAGDPVIAVAHTRNVEALREELGDDAAAVDLRDSADWYHSPGKSFAGFIGFAAAHPDASCIRMVGEPIWPVEWSAGVAEYAHYESVFNAVAKDAPVWAMCPYAVDALPDVVLDHAAATHPELETCDGVHTSTGYVDPDAYCTHLASRASAPGIRVRRFDIEGDLASLRAVVAAEAWSAGVSRKRIPELLLAVHEIAMNAITHGGGHAVARTWQEPRAFVCEIEDHGPGLSELYAGYVPPSDDSDRGRGLWLARQLCEIVEVQSREGTTRVRLHLRRG